jgi:transaldolase
MSTYAERLYQETPTRYWVNNPTPEEARKSIEEMGNVVCIASNCNYPKKVLTSPETKDEAIANVDRLIKDGIADDDLIVAMTSEYMLKKCSEYFKPIFDKTDGMYGWVAIQGNPFHDTDYDFMLAEAKRFYGVMPNMRVKFPATEEAVAVLSKLTEMGKATLATCGFSIPYTRAACDAYMRGVKKAAGEVPTLYMTTLTGPFDEIMGKYVKAHDINVSADVLKWAGCILSKELYKINQTTYADVNITMLGGCRESYHFTEMVPGKMHITVNYDFMERLNDLNPALEDRMSKQADESVITELCEKIPPFSFAMEKDLDAYQSWSTHSPALYFRNYLKNGWNVARGIVKERRILSK